MDIGYTAVESVGLNETRQQIRKIILWWKSWRQQTRQLQSELQSERQARVWQLQVLHQQLADAQVKAGEAVALQEEIALLKQEV